MINGIIIVRKEQGYTSADVVAKMRGICRQRKIGHTGTLDPNATGVLPICLGNATRLCDMLTDQSKEYIATLRLGQTTDTQDIWGQVLSDTGEKYLSLEEQEITDCIMSFTGEYLQLPPMYSAIKQHGNRLYELAREGKEVEREPRRVEILSLEILSFSLPEIQIRVECTKGTYIRTLCYDIGEKLGCGAVMSALVRTHTGGFSLEDAYTLQELEQLRDAGELEKIVRSVDSCFTGFPVLETIPDADVYHKLYNGNQLTWDMVTRVSGDTQKQKFYRVYDHEHIFCGVYQERGPKILTPWKMFLNDKE